ncbi:hypothetical protein BDR06DRAFT_975619 [Suillus hirtellus]|nr:hypothetical protein BDR06DRAFT_975619 [Suillus hirtellus]
MTTNAPTITPQPTFCSNYEKGEEPTNWMRNYQLSFPSSYSEAEKIAQLSCSAQTQAQQRHVVLKEEDIGIMIEEDRGQEWGHMKWAKEIAQMAQGFNDSQCHLLDTILENMPEVLQDFLADNYASLADFEADVAKISASQLVKVKQ